MIEAATTLFRRRGYDGVGVAALLSESGAPRGSLYFHFPGGKEQIAVEALRRASQAVVEGIRRRAAATETIEAYVETACAGWARNLVASDFEKGCLVGLVGLEAASASPALKEEAARAFADWENALAEMATEKGLGAAAARCFARAFINAVQGAIVQARVRHDAGVMDDAAAATVALVRGLRASA